MKKEIKIGNRKIGEGHPVFIIAEVGVNHNGGVRLAKKMIDAAKNAGVDAVKFQTYRTEELLTKSAPKADYQKKTVGSKSQFQMLKELELSQSDFRKLSAYCAKKGVIFLSTPFDLSSAKFLQKTGVPAFKISSGDLSNIPLLMQISKYKKPIILSTGMSSTAEIKEAVKALKESALVLMQCTSNYPARFEDANLRAIKSLKDIFKVPVGYSDHTPGVEASIAAATMGAVIIEKHFTLDRSMRGPDHKASLEPDEFAALVRFIRNVEKAMGTGIKSVLPSEKRIKKLAARSIVAIRDLPVGTRLSLNDITVKRPAGGITPKYFRKIIGMRVKKPLKADRLIKWEEVSS